MRRLLWVGMFRVAFPCLPLACIEYAEPGRKLKYEKEEEEGKKMER